MDQFLVDKIRMTIGELALRSGKCLETISELSYFESGYKKIGEYPDLSMFTQTLKRGERIFGKDKHFWFHTEIDTPSVKEGEELVIELITGKKDGGDALNPQGLLYLNGKAVQGTDINHRTVHLEPENHYDVMLYFYTGMKDDMKCEVMMNLVNVNHRVRDLYFDINVPYEAALLLDPRTMEYAEIVKHLEQACNLIDFRDVGEEAFLESVDKARAYLKEEFYGKACGASDVIVNYIGHTHIDVAWLWTLAQTREKTQRSFATVLNLMEQYPEYIFMSSQPQLYEYFKEEQPELFEKLKQRIKEGRWEAEGGMWLEADCNLTSGESIIRQIMHGKKFMKEELGVDNHILWLPDVFGYNASMPQILKKTGIDTFVTSKISWSESNMMPVDTFMWQGIDGTEIFTYFLTAQDHHQFLAHQKQTTYVGFVNPNMHLGTWERYQQKEYTNEAIVTYGYGDGGGGPTLEMIEMERRLEKGLPGFPKAQMSKAGDFLDRVKSDFEKNCELTGRTPKWVGELYLEVHRGTYTSIAKNKKNNRKSEFLCQDTENVSVMDKLLLGGEYPQEALFRNWKVILLNQFHDIIPGSSIPEVYEDSDRQYAALFDEIGGIKMDKLSKIAANVNKKGILVYNPNPFEVSSYARNDEGLVYAENVPAMGWKVIENTVSNGKVKVSEKRVETDMYVIVFDDDMNISSLFDKVNGREIVEKGKAFNKIRAFEDYPKYCDNWEITNYYKQKSYDDFELVSVKSVEGEGFGGFEVVRKYLNSEIRQRIVAYANSPRIDFETDIEWNEHHNILKAFFPTNILTTKAVYDIQFGNLERPTHSNTSWDAAKFEVCGQKWADISEGNYGFSLLNDCKYGHSCEGGELALTLVKAGTDPNPMADIGHHSFTYSIYPHSGDFRNGTVQQAYILNKPLVCVPALGEGKLPESYSLVSCNKENIIAETVKMAENGEGVVVRMYECHNQKTDATLKLGFDAKKIYLCDMLENKLEEIGSGNTVTLPVGNYEIVTILAEI